MSGITWPKSTGKNWSIGLAGSGTVLLLLCMFFTAREMMPVATDAACQKNLLGALSQETTKKDNDGELRIIDVFPNEVSLGSQLCVVVAGVAKSADPKTAAVDIPLYLNGERTMISDKARPVPDPQLLQYPFGEHADATTDASKFWRSLLAGKTKNGTMVLSVGLSTMQTSQPSVRAKDPINFTVYKTGILWLGVAAMLVLFAAFVVFAASSTVLRDSATLDTTGKPNGTYSLGRTQMALWLGLTVAGFIFLWLTLGFYLHVITSAILVLLGINSVTGLASVLIDNPPSGANPSASPPNATTTAGQQTPATNQSPSATQQTAATNQSATPNQQAGAQNQSPPPNPATMPKSTWFWQDLVCDSTGPKLHRIQMIAWTCILAIIFTWNVFWNFVFVEFDPNLLLLMGIASGTYLGFKPQEK